MSSSTNSVFRCPNLPSQAFGGWTACRRAVAVLLSSKSKDQGPLAAAQVVGYLASFQVPLFLWAPDEQTLTRHRLPGDAPAYVGANGMQRLFEGLRHSLAAQRVVWLEGDHLPHHVILADAAPSGLRLVN